MLKVMGEKVNRRTADYKKWKIKTIIRYRRQKPLLRKREHKEQDQNRVNR